MASQCASNRIKPHLLSRWLKMVPHRAINPFPDPGKLVRGLSGPSVLRPAVGRPSRAARTRSKLVRGRVGHRMVARGGKAHGTAIFRRTMMLADKPAGNTLSRQTMAPVCLLRLPRWLYRANICTNRPTRQLVARVRGRVGPNAAGILTMARRSC